MAQDQKIGGMGSECRSMKRGVLEGKWSGLKQIEGTKRVKAKTPHSLATIKLRLIHNKFNQGSIFIK